MNHHRLFAGLLLAWAMAAGAAPADDFIPCPSFDAGGYGPYNYVTDKDKLPIVEHAHFTPEVRNLIRGNRGTLMGDIDYTLRHFPNHHLALLSVSNYSRRRDFQDDAFWSNHGRFPVECYFQNAVRFAPNDPNVYLIYAIHLHRNQEYRKAMVQYQAAVKMAPNNPETHYNLGLLYVDLKDFKAARAQAEIAYKSGYPLPGLRNRLKQAGAW